MTAPRFPWPMGDKRRGGPLLGPGGPPELFAWNPEEAEALPATSTFTRASVAQVLTTTDGVTFWTQEAKSGEVRLDGLRRVENFNDAPLFSDSSWNLISGATKSGDRVLTPSDNQGVEYFRDTTAGTNTGRTFWALFKVIGDGTIRATVRDALGLEADFVDLTLTSTFTLMAVKIDFATSTDFRFGIQFRKLGGATTTFIEAEFVDYIQDQPGSTTPPPDVVHATIYNAEVAGVRYFDTANGNSVDGLGVVTEATGATITDGGYLGEPVNLPQEADVVDSGVTIPNEFSALFDFTAPDTIGGGETPSLLGAAASAVDILRLDASFNVVMDDGGTPTTIGTVAASQRFKISYGRDATGRSASLNGATAVTGDAPSAAHEGESFQLYSTASVNQARGIGHQSTIYSGRLSDSDLEDLSS